MNESTSTSIHYVHYQSSPLTFKLEKNKYIDKYFWFYDKETSFTKYKNEFSYSSSFIFNPTLLGKITLYCQVTYKNGKENIYSFPIHVLPRTTLYQQSKLYSSTMIIKNKENIIVYKFDKVKLKVEGASSYKWRPIYSSEESLPSSCYPTFYTDIVEFTPQRDLSYEVIGYDESGGSSSIFFNIVLKDKPMDILDIELIPNLLFEEVLSKKKNRIIQILKKNKKLLDQLTEFYNITLMSAHNTEFQSKSGRGYRIPWVTYYQIKEDRTHMLLSFEQQYQFLRYLLNNTNPHGKSHFMYLMNIIQYNFVLPSPSAYGFNIRRERYGP